MKLGRFFVFFPLLSDIELIKSLATDQPELQRYVCISVYALTTSYIHKKIMPLMRRKRAADG